MFYPYDLTTGLIGKAPESLADGSHLPAQQLILWRFLIATTNGKRALSVFDIPDGAFPIYVPK
jgi:hypothetical protein